MAHFDMRFRLAALLLGLAPLLATMALADERIAAAKGAKVFFIDLKDGQTIPARSTVRFGISGMTLAPADSAKPNTGHHHLLIDTGLPPLDAPIPSDFDHVHFGKGQTEVELSLTPGPHTLQLLLADHRHVPHDPPVVSEVIHVTVDPATVQKPRTQAPGDAKAFFVDLADGARIPTKSTIKFGLSGMELAPAGTEKPGSGHHHLLIDAPLPPLDREIPSDFNHVHFGRGQTSTEVTLTPGEHTLQLMVGDHQHMPHDPPVVSNVVHVVVVESPGAEAAQAAPPTGRQPSPPDGAVYFVYPRDGEMIYPKSTIRFGLRNMGVAPAGVVKANTGHHHLIIDADLPDLDAPIPNDPNHLHFGAGQTEVKLNLTPGEHTLQLILGDDRHMPHNPPIVSAKIKVMAGYPKRARASSTVRVSKRARSRRAAGRRSRRQPEP
jgi:Domain of unknown function (DUF4399)